MEAMVQFEFEKLLPELGLLVVERLGPCEVSLLALTSKRYHDLFRSKMVNTNKLMDLAAQNGSINLLNELCGPSWRVEPMEDPDLPTYQASALEMAIEYGQNELLMNFIKVRMKKFRNQKSFMLFFSLAARFGNQTAFEILLKGRNEPAPSVPVFTKAMETALEFGNIDFVKYLAQRWPEMVESCGAHMLRVAAVASANLDLIEALPSLFPQIKHDPLNPIKHPAFYRIQGCEFYLKIKSPFAQNGGAALWLDFLLKHDIAVNTLDLLEDAILLNDFKFLEKVLTLLHEPVHVGILDLPFLVSTMKFPEQIPMLNRVISLLNPAPISLPWPHRELFSKSSPPSNYDAILATGLFQSPSDDLQRYTGPQLMWLIEHKFIQPDKVFEVGVRSDLPQAVALAVSKRWHPPLTSGDLKEAMRRQSFKVSVWMAHQGVNLSDPELCYAVTVLPSEVASHKIPSWFSMEAVRVTIALGMFPTAQGLDNFLNSGNFDQQRVVVRLLTPYLSRIGLTAEARKKLLAQYI